MATSDEGDERRPWWRQPFVTVPVLVAGVIAVAWVVYSVLPDPQPPVMPPEKFTETFKAADQTDKENWDRMWREAGKTPPPKR